MPTKRWLLGVRRRDVFMVLACGLVAVAATSGQISDTAVAGTAGESGASVAALTPVQLVSPEGADVYEPQMAVAPNGTAVFAWLNGGAVEARVRSADGTLGAIETISSPGSVAWAPRVAIDRNGNAVFAWEARDTPTSTSSIESRVRAAAGILQSPQTLSSAATDALSPQIAVDGHGNAFFTWWVLDAPNSRVEARVRSATGFLTAVETLSGEAKLPYVAATPNGRAVFTWEHWNGANWVIQARVRSAIGVLHPTLTLSGEGLDASNPRVAIDPTGNAVFTWDRDRSGFPDRVQARALSATGALSPVQTLSGRVGDAWLPRVGMDRNGNAVFAWQRRQASPNFQIEVRARSATGALSQVQVVSTAGRDAFFAEVAVERNGRATIAWAEKQDGVWRVKAVRRSPDGALTAVQTISRAGRHGQVPQLGIDADGNATLAWLVGSFYDSRNFEIHTRRLLK